MKRFYQIVCVCVALCLPLSTMARDKELTQRVNRLEQMVQGQTLVSIATRVEQLEGEVQRLYGENENMQYEMRQLKQQQKIKDKEIAARLAKLEAAGSSSYTQPPSSYVPPTSPGYNYPQPPLVTPPTNTNPTPTQPTAQEGEAAYRTALQKLRNGEYDAAATALSSFPWQYPKSSYVPNSYYWQGEAHYVLNRFDKAIQAFETVVTQYPRSNKVPDAALKIGFSQHAQGRAGEARATLTGVANRYSGTSVGRLAKSKLDSMR